MTEIAIEIELPETILVEIETNGLAAQAAESAAAAAISAAIATTSAILPVMGASHVLMPGNQTVEIDHASANTVIVPADADATFEIGNYVNLVQTGVGETSIVPAEGVTLNSHLGMRTLAGQWAGATLYKRGPNAWWLGGTLKA